MSHLNVNNTLLVNQHGFGDGYSCATQLIILREDILHALDHQKQVDIILLDLQKLLAQGLLTMLWYSI